MSIVSILRKLVPDINSLSVYELSSRGPLFHYLKRNARRLTFSEYFADVPIGEIRNKIQCQDVQQLTYANSSFDICTSTDVFEHIPDDSKGFSNICRVLKSSGIFIFTVPLLNEYKTTERAVLDSNGEVEHLLSPEFHGDPISESGSILAYRNYGRDITDKLLGAGFLKAEIIMPEDITLWNLARPVIVAYKQTD